MDAIIWLLSFLYTGQDNIRDAYLHAIDDGNYDVISNWKKHLKEAK